MKTLRKTLLTLSLAAVSAGGVACTGAVTDEEALVGEASSALTVAEESGDVTADAVGAEGATDLAASADEAAVLPELPGDADGVCDFGARRARVLARYDANGDGRLGPAERQQLKSDLEARRGAGFAFRFGVLHRVHALQRLRWVFDTDHSGALSSEERVAMMDALEARCERIRANVLARFDANGNGTLEEAERQTAKDALRARIQALRQQVLTQYDVNGNGALDEAEREQLRADRVAAFQARRAQVVAQFDADGDGVLSDAEKTALKNAIIARISGGQDAE